MAELNRYERIFMDAVDALGFQIIRYEDFSFGLIDFIGGAYSGMEDERFNTVQELVKEIEGHIEEYLVTGLQTILRDKFNDDTDKSGSPLVEHIRAKYLSRLEEYEARGVDFLDVLTNHLDKINLNKIAADAKEEV